MNARDALCFLLLALGLTATLGRLGAGLLFAAYRVAHLKQEAEE